MAAINRLSIHARVGILAGLSAFAIIALLSVFFVSRVQTDAAIERELEFAEVERLALEMEVGALQMRRREKDFLLRRDIEYLDRYLVDADSVARVISDIEAHELDAVSRAAAGRLAEALPRHRVAFERVVAQAVELGLTPSEGLEGRLRASVHAVETRLNEFGDAELTVLMLMMRRHEKDFMLRVQSRYVDRFATRQAEFAELLATRPFSAADQAEITQLMQNYGRDFRAWSDIRLQYDEDTVTLSAVFAEMSADLDAVLSQARAGREAALIELEASRSQILLTSMAVMALVVLLTITVTWLVARSIARPIRAITDVMSGLARGEVDAAVPHGEDGGEIGEMARAVRVFQDGYREMEAMRAQRTEEEAREAETAAKARNQLADEFDSRIGQIVNELAAAASQMISSAGELHGSAQGADERAGTVASAAERTSGNTQTVASAAEELTSSIKEIHRQVSEASSDTQSAVEEANTTRQTVSGLAEAVSQISEVVSLIQSIAEQTNLLALNATIEASRAGDAGKGFAVVASEVKALADQTSNATLEIADQIDAIQASGRQAIAAIEAMTGTIDNVAAGATAISSAVEQQDSAANEIAHSVAQAAEGTAEVTASITALSAIVRDTDRASDEVLNAARSVSDGAEKLKSDLAVFIDQIRAA